MGWIRPRDVTIHRRAPIREMPQITTKLPWAPVSLEPWVQSTWSEWVGVHLTRGARSSFVWLPWEEGVPGNCAPQHCPQLQFACQWTPRVEGKPLKSVNVQNTR